MTDIERRLKQAEKRLDCLPDDTERLFSSITVHREGEEDETKYNYMKGYHGKPIHIDVEVV